MTVLSKREVKFVQKAIAIIEDEKRWSNGADARNTRGDVVPLASRQAKCFCALGALMKVAYDAVRRSGADINAAYQDAIGFAQKVNDLVVARQHHHLPAINDTNGRLAAIAALRAVVA